MTDPMDIWVYETWNSFNFTKKYQAEGLHKDFFNSNVFYSWCLRYLENEPSKHLARFILSTYNGKTQELGDFHLTKAMQKWDSSSRKAFLVSLESLYLMEPDPYKIKEQLGKQGGSLSST